MLQILAVSAALAGANVDLPALFAEQLPAIKARTTRPVLLPQALPDRFDEYFPSGAASRSRWRLDVGGVPDCGGAGACFVAHFAGRRRGAPSGSRVVELARGRIGRFDPMSCGASCSPPSVEWRERHTTFTIQARVGRRALLRMANSAIRNGPR